MPVLSKLPKKALLTNLAFLLVALIWGAAGPIIKYTLGFIPPFTLLFLRLLVVCIVLLPFAIYMLMGTKIAKKDYWNLFLLGVFSETALILCFVGLEYTNALDATIISIITGALTVYAGHYFYREKVNKRVNMGLLLTGIGTLVVILEPVFLSAPQGAGAVSIGDRILGNVLTVIYNLTWVIYVIWSKMSMGENSKLLKKTLSFVHIRPMSKPYSPILITTLSMYVGLITFIPTMILENSGFFGQVNFSLLAIDPRGIMGVLYLALLSSIVAYSLYQWALENGTVADSVFYGYLTPVFTFPVAFLLLGEIPTAVLMIGTVIIVSGVVMAEVGEREANCKS
jgi:drug/metabolite transporter (DMT)-like permease